MLETDINGAVAVQLESILPPIVNSAVEAALQKLTDEVAEARPAEYPDNLTTEQTAKYLQCSTQRIEIWRHHGEGPPYIKLGRMVRYRKSDLDEWIESHKVDANEGKDQQCQ